MRSLHQWQIFCYISVAILHSDGPISQSGVKTFHNGSIHPHSGTCRGKTSCSAIFVAHTNTHSLSHLSQNKWAAPPLLLLHCVSLMWMKEVLGDLTTLISTPMERVQYSCSWWNTSPGDATLPAQMIPPTEQRLSPMKGFTPENPALNSNLFCCCKELQHLSSVFELD